MALLKYGKYIEKLKLTAQDVHMKIAEDEIRYKKCADNLFEHNQFFFCHSPVLICHKSAKLHANMHAHKCIPHNCNAMREA